MTQLATAIVVDTIIQPSVTSPVDEATVNVSSIMATPDTATATVTASLTTDLAATPDVADTVTRTSPVVIPTVDRISPTVTQPPFTVSPVNDSTSSIVATQRVPSASIVLTTVTQLATAIVDDTIIQFFKFVVVPTVDRISPTVTQPPFTVSPVNDSTSSIVSTQRVPSASIVVTTVTQLVTAIVDDTIIQPGVTSSPVGDATVNMSSILGNTRQSDSFLIQLLLPLSQLILLLHQMLQTL